MLKYSGEQKVQSEIIGGAPKYSKADFFLSCFGGMHGAQEEAGGIMNPKLSISLIIVCAICNISCSDLGNAPDSQAGQVIGQFQLLNSRGQQATTFDRTDTIVFVYRLHNKSGRDITIAMANGGPLVRFIVRQDTSIVKDSFEGYIFPMNAPTYPFRKDQSIEARWIIDANTLAREEYVALAEPQMVVPGFRTPSQQSSALRIQQGGCVPVRVDTEMENTEASICL